MHFLIVDTRFGTPIHVFLEIDPRGTEADPGLAVREVAIDFVPITDRASSRKFTIGQNPRHTDQFREFGSEAAAAGAGFILIEPCYLGPTWDAYARDFRPQGEKPTKSTRRTSPTAKAH